MLGTEEQGLVDLCQVHLCKNGLPPTHSQINFLKMTITLIAVPNFLLAFIVLILCGTAVLCWFISLKLMLYSFLFFFNGTLCNIFRCHIPHGAGAQAFCSKSDIPCSNWTHEHWGYELYGNTGFFVLPNFFPHGPSFSAMPSLEIRKLSLQAGAMTSDNEMDDGFSDLDSPPETDKIGTIVDEEDNEFVSEWEISGDELKVDSAEVADRSLGLSDSKSQVNGEKEPRRMSLASPIFKVVMEAPWHSVNDTLNKWVEEGNSLGRDEISMTPLNLRKRRFWCKGLAGAQFFLS